VDTSEGTESHNPFTITAEKDELSGLVEEVIEQDKQLSIVVRLPVKEEGFSIPVELLIVLGSTIILGAGVGAFLASEGFKIALVSLIVPLYMKLKKSKLLDNYDRGRVYQYIEINPGEHYNQIKRDLSLPNGSLVYHLNVLEKADKIKSRKDGRYRRFYTKGTHVPQTNGGELTEIQKRITDTVQDLPGLTQKEMASLLGVHQSSISYQMTKLAERGFIRTEKKGRKVHYYYVGNR
jgi:DNA-binding transcriptional ArsR family regulator